MEKLLSPFDKEQVVSLNAFQVDSSFKSIRCQECKTTLIATDQGFVCYPCDIVVQQWAWDWMLNWEWTSMSESVNKFMSGDHSEFHSRFRSQFKGNKNDFR